MKLVIVCLLFELLEPVLLRQQWLEEPGYAEVNPGGTVLLACRVSNKKGECRWERNSMPVGAYPGKYEWAGQREAGDCSLRIEKAEQEYDSGEWVCQITASSFMEKDTLMSKPAKLIVRGKPEPTSIPFFLSFAFYFFFLYLLFHSRRPFPSSSMISPIPFLSVSAPLRF